MNYGPSYALTLKVILETPQWMNVCTLDMKFLSVP